MNLVKKIKENRKVNKLKEKITVFIFNSLSKII